MEQPANVREQRKGREDNNICRIIYLRVTITKQSSIFSLFLLFVSWKEFIATIRSCSKQSTYNVASALLCGTFFIVLYRGIISFSSMIKIEVAFLRYSFRWELKNKPFCTKGKMNWLVLLFEECSPEFMWLNCKDTLSLRASGQLAAWG